MRLAVPAGFMPMADAHGRVTIMPCPGTMPAAATPHHGGKVHHQPDGEPAKPCAFALSLAPASDPPIAVAVMPPLASVEVAPPIRATRGAPGRGLAAPPPPATGPPALA